MKILWGAFGLVSLAIGFVGMFLPLVPTVPLVLLAAFCFSRSSDRLHNWLLDHDVFGPAIQHWRESGAITSRAKKLATISILAVFLISIVTGVPAVILAIQIVVLSAVLIFIWSRPTG